MTGSNPCRARHMPEPGCDAAVWQMIAGPSAAISRVTRGHSRSPSTSPATRLAPLAAVAGPCVRLLTIMDGGRSRVTATCPIEGSARVSEGY
jgi:hypothetical protein